jgi:5-methylcytosine-specific restriction endonuclease McrA
VAQVGRDEERPASLPVRTVRSPTLVIRSAVRRTPRAVNWRLRFLVMQRDGFRCCNCGSSPAKGHAVSLQVDHVVPWSRGGETTFENLQTLCETCNIGKSDLGHESAGA